MRALERIKHDVVRLRARDREALLDWLTNVLEDRSEFSDEFKGKMEPDKADIISGYHRVAKSNALRSRRLKKFFAKWDATHSVSIGDEATRKSIEGGEKK